jgi:anti-sigma regulatory factor (Ser/Thr protein kinase)
MAITQKGYTGMLADAGLVMRGKTVSHIDLVTLPSSPFWARRHTEAMLKLWHAEYLIDTADLLVSELVTNAVVFSGDGKPGPGLEGVRRIRLALRLLTSELFIEVADPDPRPPVPVRGIAEDAENGRGLMLVEALSREWNYYLPPSGGKVVYCVIEA